MKQIFSTGLLLFLVVTASAQSDEKLLPPPPPPPPPKAAPLNDKNLPADYKDFLKRNITVERVNWNKEQVIIITKDGKQERFARTEAGEKQAEAQYGKLPVAPPPPPPPPPARSGKTPPPPPTPPSPPQEIE